MAKGLPPLPTVEPDPKPQPDPEASRPQDATVLLPIIVHMVNTAPDAMARHLFVDLLDAARRPCIPLPTLRDDGRSSRGTRSAVAYTAVVRCIRLIRSEAPVRAIKDAFNFAHDATFMPTAWVIGSQEEGFTLTFNAHSAAGR